MPEQTPTNRFITTLGPIKLEVITVENITTADTVVSNIQRPLFATANLTNTGANTALATNVSISGRTLTLTNANISAGVDDATILVFGF
jgi:hypothetical protein